MEKTSKTYFIVEIGGADFYFEKLQEASDFFSKLAYVNAEKINQLGYGKDAYYYKDGKHTPHMKQETIAVYPNEKAARFAKSESGENNDSE